MLDKSLPYFRVILKRNAGTPVPAAALPPGYTFALYTAGDETAWGAIETSVLEFESVAEATDYFKRDYVSYASEVVRRTLFVQTATGEKVGTFTAWWNYTGLRRHPWMHWVAVKPEHQGKGIGKAMIATGVQRMVDIEGDCDMYIPTQTWSHKAIRLYRWVGFELLVDELRPGGFENQTAAALDVLKPLL